MPSIRAAKSRKLIAENIGIKENLSTCKKETRRRNKARAGREAKDSRKSFKEINHREERHSKQLKKDKTLNKTHNEKMVQDGDSSDNEMETIAENQPEKTTENQPTETTGNQPEETTGIQPEEITENSPEEITENQGRETTENQTEEITENKEINATTNEKENKTLEEPMEVTEGEKEGNENGSPTKKQKTEETLEDKTESEATAVQVDDNEHTAQIITEGNDKEKALTNNLKSSSFSLKSHSNTNKNNEDTNPATSSNLPKQLLTVISNLYLNVGERLRLDFPPRCLDDLANCHRNHYRSDLPEAPIPSQAHSLRSALQHYRYVSFINSTTDMCHRGEFPGKGIFTKIIELVLSINYVTKQPNVNIPIYQQSYHKSIELFSMIVRSFPPCWHKMRPYYVGFLEYGLDLAKLKTDKEEALSKSSKIFDIILDLLEDVLKNSKPEDLAKSKSEKLKLPTSNVEATSPLNNTELSMCSEYWNQNEYEERERQKQTFDALPMDQKVERVFMALRLLLQILENDLAMWMLHHNKKTKEWIFCSDNRPLIVVLCELTQYTRMTRVARRIFSVYSEAASKGLCKNRLNVLERYISLLMVASNTADMENTAIGVKYPFLGEQTKTLIHEFFKIFKAHNREEIIKYMETIELLRIPYVRYEFIDNVLIMFQFTNSEILTPQKIALDVAKKRWLKYKPASELSNADEYLSREQYLHLLLVALRSYCDFHGSKTFLHVITETAQISHLTTTNDSVHRWPTHGNGVLVLKKMAKDINQLESLLKMTVRMSKPKVDLPLADIYIDEEIILKYRTDLKFIISLQNVLLKQKEAYPDVDFSEWLDFLNDFSPKKNDKEETN